MKPKNALGKLLKKRRAGLALSQRALAEQLGVKPSHIAYLESGKPDEPVFARISNYVQSRYGFNLDARLPAHKKLPYLAGMVHYAKLRRALLNEYGI